MARFSDDTINKIKRDVSLLALVERQGYEVKKHGVKDVVVSCPFHDDKTPSCVITPKENLFHCFGCGEAGSVIDWVMKTQGVSFRHAVEILQQENPHLAATDKVVKKSTVPKVASFLVAEDVEKSDDAALLGKVVAYYHQCLLDSPEALDYLKQRGLDNVEAIKTFKLGYANRTLGYRLPHKNRAEGKLIRERLQVLGVFRESGHEHFTGSLVIPVLDEHGTVQEVYGRKLLGNRLRKGTPIHTYLPGEHQGILNPLCLRATEEIILCESLIDALTFWVNGFKNVTASYGTHGFTDDHLAALKHYTIKRVLIAYDNDKAGNEATAKLTKTLTVEGFDCFRIEVPKGMDVNEYALAVQPAQKSLSLVIRQAVWLGNGQRPDITTHAENAPAELSTIEALGDSLVDVDIGEVLDTPNTASSLVAETEPTTAVPPVADSLTFTEQGNDLLVALDNLTWRIRGLEKNTNPEQLKLNVLVKNDTGFHVDNLDMYASRARQAYAKQASIELCVSENTIKQHVGRLLLALEIKQDTMLKARQQQGSDKVMSEAEREAALALLKDTSLLSRILADLETCGVVGERTNKLVGYLAATSRKLDKPLAVMIQSSSAAGKSSLMEAILQLFPDEQQVKYSAMTGQSLFYMGETNLKHKILAIAEEEGAEHASYALKLLQSEGEVSIASTGKNPVTGNLETQQYKVEGPVMLMMTTTAIDIDEELLNRCLVLSVNESREQTESIHAKQRHSQTLEGLLQQQSKHDLVNLHQNAQRLIRPLLVANPYAEQLTFLSDKTRTRRDHMKYLTLIRTIALLHQHQRPIKRIEHTTSDGTQLLEYIEVERDDIVTANRLAHEVLGRSLDELPPQTRKLLKLIMEMVKQACATQAVTQPQYRFTRKDIRHYTGWSDNQLKVHCVRLVDMEYLLVHGGGRGAVIYYELLYDGALDDTPHLMGLINEEQLEYDAQKLGQPGSKLALSGGQVGGKLDSSCTPDHDGTQGLAVEQGDVTDNHALLAHNVRHHNGASSFTPDILSSAPTGPAKAVQTGSRPVCAAAPSLVASHTTVEG
jgi:DNA primase catalytic core